jgi:hypothetical protein
MIAMWVLLFGAFVVLLLKGAAWEAGPYFASYFAFVILMVAAVNFSAYINLYHQLSKHHPADHDLVLAAIPMFIGLQLPWLWTIGCYRQTKNLVSGTGSGVVGRIRFLELARTLGVYTAILMILDSISSMLR